MSFLHLFLIGTLIGTAMIIPGVSGGVLAVIFNVYDKMINSLTNLFKDFKKNFIFLAILGSGIGVGAIWFSKVMMFLYNYHEVVTKFAFVGLILGGVPYLFKEVKQNTNQTVNYKAMVITFLISVGLWFISSYVVNIDMDANFKNPLVSIINLFIAGIIYSIGKVIPGISGSFLLIIIGMYEYVLSILSNPFAITVDDVLKLIPFVGGLILGVVVLLKLMNYLLKHHFRTVYSVIIGFVIGSVPVLIPGLVPTFDLLKGVSIMGFCFFLSYKLSK
ncbi:MAG: DUF368 domain-containing protein [Bacilli bacterium]|nr:DUF368 domain-containing protein [Bacilli bacterium]